MLPIPTYPSLKVELANDPLEASHQRSSQRRRVQIVQYVEGQQFGHAHERLVADAVHHRRGAGAVRQLHFVDDEVADLDVLLDAQHIVADARVAVAHQKNARLAFGQQQFVRLLSRELAVIPAGAVVHIEWGVHRALVLCVSKLRWPDNDGVDGAVLQSRVYHANAPRNDQ